MLVILGFLAVWTIQNRPPSDEQRTRATQLAQADRGVLDELAAGALDAMGVKVDRTINDFPAFGCFTNQMIATGSRSSYEKSLAVAKGSERDALQKARDYLARVNADRFGSRGQLSDPSEIDSPRRTVHLYVDNFGISFSDEGVNGFRMSVSGPCREG